jgi:uncharacterized protein
MIGLLLAFALAAAIGLGVYACWIEPRRLVVTRYEVRSPAWPADAPDLRIVAMSDFHASGPHITADRIAAIVGRANAERPDLVALLGDFVFETRVRTSFVPPVAVAAALAGLRARLGVFAVLGNHDWKLDGPWVARALAKAGLIVLDNAACRIEADGRVLWVAGVGDRAVYQDDLPGTLARVPDGAPVLLVTHSPDLFPEVPERVALTLAGHTHGGQCELPVLTRFVIPSRHGRRYAYGHIVEGGRQMFVSSGIGTANLPVRFGVPPEIVLLRIGAPGSHSRESNEDRPDRT